MGFPNNYCGNPWSDQEKTRITLVAVAGNQAKIDPAYHQNTGVGNYRYSNPLFDIIMWKQIISGFSPEREFQ
jgi:hypothetical protein